MDFLQLTGKSILIFGVANRKSVAWHIGRVLSEAGARCVYVVENDQVRQSAAKLLGQSEVYICDVQRQEQIDRLREELAARKEKFHGLVALDRLRRLLGRAKAVPRNAQAGILAGRRHFLLFADRPVQRPQRPARRRRLGSDDFHFQHAHGQRKLRLHGPVKAALDDSLGFLAKSFSRFSRVRFNAVAPGLLKTSASAGIPGYVQSYLYAEQVIPRKKAVQTEEAAHAAAFLLSPRSSGINAQRIVVDAGMSINYFDRQLIDRAGE